MADRVDCIECAGLAYTCGIEGLRVCPEHATKERELVANTTGAEHRQTSKYTRDGRVFSTTTTARDRPKSPPPSPPSHRPRSPLSREDLFSGHRKHEHQNAASGEMRHAFRREEGDSSSPHPGDRRDDDSIPHKPEMTRHGRFPEHQELYPRPQTVNAGKIKINRYAGAPEKKKLFGTSPMEVHLNIDSQPSAMVSSAGAITDTSRSLCSDSVEADRTTEEGATMYKHTEPFIFQRVTTAKAISNDERRHIHDTDGPSSASIQSPINDDANGMLRFPWLTSPSNGISRPKEDAASSISGRTSSEKSESAGRSCHVCKVRAVVDSLTKCSTCSRRYHRHCHPGNSIPMDHGHYPANTNGSPNMLLSASRDKSLITWNLTRDDPSYGYPKRSLHGHSHPKDLSSWQCRRCVTKKVPRRLKPAVTTKRVQESANKGVNGRARPVDEVPSFGLLASRQNDPPHETSSHDVPLRAGDITISDRVLDPPNQSASIERNTEKSREHDATNCPGARLKIHEQMEVDFNDPLFSEAQGLVDKSFASFKGGKSGHDGQKKPVKLSFVRQKVKPKTNTHDDPRSESNHGLSANAAPLNTAPEAEVLNHANAGVAVAATERMPQTLPKPTRTDVVVCEGCGGRKTPRNPMGKSFCSRCKRESTSSVQESTSETVLAETKKNNPPTVKEAAGATIPTDGVPTNARVNQTISRGNVKVLGNPNPVKSQAGGSPSKRPKSACDDCRKRHWKCAHDSSPGKSATVVADTGLQLRQPPISRSPPPDIESRATSKPPECVTTSVPTKRPIPEETPKDPPAESRDNIASPSRIGSVEPSSKLPRDRERTETSVSLSGHKRIRQCFRTNPLDENDLGDSYNRPKSTYWRLLALALSDAPSSRIQSVSVPQWVADNIPGYEMGAGNWEQGLQSTMIMNAKGHSGDRLAMRVKWKEGDGGSGTGDWYELLPDLKDNLEHWDHELKRPVRGPKTLQQSPLNAAEDVNVSTTEENPNNETNSGIATEDAAEDTSANGGADANDGGKTPVRSLTNSASKPRVVQATVEDLAVENTKNKSKSRSLSEVEAMDIDTDKGMFVSEASDDEPLAVKRQKKQLARPAGTVDSANVSSALLDGRSMSLVQTGAECQQAESSRNAPNAEPAVAAVPKYRTLINHAELREFFRLDMESTCEPRISKLEGWHLSHFYNQSDREDREIEISRRKTRKQMFGKNPLKSRLLDKGLDLRPTLQGMLLKHKDGPEIFEGDVTQRVPCETLDQFFNIPEWLVPGILQGELVFRKPGKRVVYRTGI